MTTDTKALKQQNDNRGQADQKNQKSANLDNAHANQQNGENLDKTGKKLIGQMRGRLQANGKTIEFNELFNILREQHNINTAAEFAALSDDQRQAIEAAL